MKKFFVVCLLLFALFCPLISRVEESIAHEILAEEQPVLRALLVSSDLFLSKENTFPAGKTNTALVLDALRKDSRTYKDITVINDEISSVDALREAIYHAFKDAKKNDICFFYISTHGVYNVSQSNLSAALLLSDGKKESAINATTLEEMFSSIKGTKMLVFDACNAGAMIGKGLSDPPDRPVFLGADYKVLCSAGGSEESWYFKSKDGQNIESGASYFASTFSRAMSKEDGYPADHNKDGIISLNELYQYIFDHYAASTPQVYPQKDDAFPFFTYNVEEQSLTTSKITNISFEDTVLYAPFSTVNFSFNVQQEGSVLYQIVYYQMGRWQFESAQYIQDTVEGEVLTKGKKQRTLSLALQEEALDTSGYAMIQVFSKDEKDVYTLEGSKLLSVHMTEGDVLLEASAGRLFFPKRGQELAVRVYHDAPCALTVSVLNESGDTVCYLEYDTPSRPQRLVPEGSCFYWDGKDKDGNFCEEGYYTIKVRTYVAGEIYVAYTNEVLLKDTKSRPRLG